MEVKAERHTSSAHDLLRARIVTSREDVHAVGGAEGGYRGKRHELMLQLQQSSCAASERPSHAAHRANMARGIAMGCT
eukprot:753748-Prymnesium_polylepis.1